MMMLTFFFTYKFGLFFQFATPLLLPLRLLSLRVEIVFLFNFALELFTLWRTMAFL